jgi:hypothetical protein
MVRAHPQDVLAQLADRNLTNLNNSGSQPGDLFWPCVMHGGDLGLLREGCQIAVQNVWNTDEK